MTYQVTVRHGERYRYHTFTVEADDVPAALRAAADGMPDEVASGADLVELRPAPEPEDRAYVPGGG